LFNIVNHGISDEIMDNFDWAMRAFFELPQESKSALKRDRGNAYGYANDELTKQTPDHKEVFFFFFFFAYYLCRN
jgi:isopenicillin N synthase-like dioxygenase